MSLVTLEDVRPWVLKESTLSSDDTLLQSLIDAASALVVNFVNRDLVTTTYSEIYDGKGQRRLILRNYPIQTVESLLVDGVNVIAAPNQLAGGYVFNTTSVAFRGFGTFSCGIQNVLVGYTAGYDTVPDDIKWAVIELVGYKYKSRDRIGVVSHSNQNLTTDTYMVSDMPASVRSALNPYRRVVPV